MDRAEFLKRENRLTEIKADVRQSIKDYIDGYVELEGCDLNDVVDKVWCEFLYELVLDVADDRLADYENNRPSENDYDDYDIHKEEIIARKYGEAI